ncbi:hypothetical protein AOLI_G00197670 [Acnodon oligacanthus]
MDVQCATTKAQRLIRISTVGKLDYNVFLKADVLPNQSKTSVHSAWVFATSAHVVKDTGRPVAMLLPSYGRPGTENTKPDALSKQWEPLGPDPFLESKLFPLLGSWLHTFSSLWLIMEALRQEPDPGGDRPDKLYMPATGAWTFCAANFGGLVWTEISVLLLRFARYSHAARHPGLPPAKEHTLILFLVDCFSKACKFMPLPKLSSAKETVELFFSTWSGFTGRENDVCGSLSASSWELLRVCPLASTQKPTTRLRASIKTLPRLCGA